MWKLPKIIKIAQVRENWPNLQKNHQICKHWPNSQHLRGFWKPCAKDEVTACSPSKHWMEPESAANWEEVVQQPEHQRCEDRPFVRLVLHSPNDPPFFVVLTLSCMFAMWVFVFYGFYVGLAKLHCGGTPPSLMVLLNSEIIISEKW